MSEELSELSQKFDDLERRHQKLIGLVVQLASELSEAYNADSRVDPRTTRNHIRDVIKSLERL